ncbi:MAG: 16S rRNA (uracil(1498)-N(3))-methyltransferase [Roseburia sp.]|nr:16S rRNA (uracil(1498)-N(3))-methyltransferase [Roseburia sp.]
MYQFFVEPSQIHVIDRRVIISGKDVNHIKNVLRMKVGEELSVSNGQDGREYRCGIRAFGEEWVECELRFIKEDGVELPGRIYLFQGLPKADKMEFIIQKAVELGVYQVIPVETKRCVVRLDEKKAKSKALRWQAISEAAAKQSRRGIIPEVAEPVRFSEAVRQAAGMEVRLIPYELAEGMDRTRELLAGVRPGQSIAVFIGPEGGFAPEEIELAMKEGIQPITLGRRILRTETAGLTVLSWLMYCLER